MEHRLLGRTGVKVSPLCLGALNFGGPTPDEEAIRIVHAALDAGVNFIDTANVYHQGRSEEAVGRALRGRRHTSNGLQYLRSQVPDYAEAVNYVDAPAVRDRKLITASGLADVEFARELLEELEVMAPDDRSLWARIFRSAKLPPDA